MSKTIATLFAVSAAASYKIDVQPSFDEWCYKFGKCDLLGEENMAYRGKVYNQTVAKINAHNILYAAGKETFDMGVNEYSAMTHDEFKKHFHLGEYAYFPTKHNATNVKILPRVARFTGTTDSVDWRTKGAVTPVKNQGQCGSCWAFSTTGSTEGRVQIATGTMPGGAHGLSEQQLMDCSKPEGDQSCQGGLMDNGFQYIVDNGGLDSEADYPYKAKNEECDKTKAKTDAAKITGFKDVAEKNAEQFAAALAQGPVSIAIEADQSAFQSYRSGVFSSKCGTRLDHGVLAVGYTDDAWIVKNSWGESWGEKGYIQMSRKVLKKAGQCGLLSQPSYPVVAKSTPTPLKSTKPLAGPYEDPNAGPCSTGEEAVQIMGLKGAFCSPKCSFGRCPSPPSGTAKGQCVLEISGSKTPTQCALICDPSGANQCPGTATCKSIQGTGICTYDN